MVVSSFALQNLTKTRYDYQSSKTSTMTMEEGLGMNKDRKRVDIREEYFVSRRLGRRSRRGVDGCG
jgi:cytochrome c oxidase assembly protein subunit 16